MEAAGDHAARVGQFDVIVDVEHQAEGYHDALLLSIGRELLANAGKHARADSVAVMVSEFGDEIVLSVSDDGVGMPHGPLLLAADGHLGLASVTARVRAVGGSLHFDEGRDRRGTVVRAVLPKSTSRFRAR
jgi:signal transduction histidine kinase